MAQHLTLAQMTTLLSATVSNLKPADISNIRDALRRVSYARGNEVSSTPEPTLGTIFATRVG